MPQPAVRSEPGVVWRITMDRPEARNALDPGMLHALVRAFGEAAGDPDCRAVVLRGAGADYCAGADLDELASVRETSGAIDYGRTFEDILNTIEHQPQPVIAEVRGVALGTGCQMVVACDLAIAAEDARFGIPASRLGVMLNYENVERLVLAVGSKRAAEMLEAGREFDGLEAARVGLVNEAVPDSDLSGAVASLVEQVSSLAPLSVKGSKRGIRAALQHLSMDRPTEGHGVADFDMMAAEAFASEDAAEGIAAFRERRRPEFKGH